LADLFQEFNDRVKVLGGNWTSYSVLGSFLLYLTGYLALRFHLTTLGISTDLSVLDERYLFTGARFLVYVAAAVPSIVLLALPFAALVWAASRLVPQASRERALARITQPTPLALCGVVLAVVSIQFVLRQCFAISDLLLARSLPQYPAWLVGMLLDDQLMPLYFCALVAVCAVSAAVLFALRDAPASAAGTFLYRLLVLLTAVQFLLLPVNYGVLVADMTLPRVATLGGSALGDGNEAWLVWEGKVGVTFLVRNHATDRRTLLTLQQQDVKRMEITGFDKIVPTLFGPGRVPAAP
jgi:hypothetical protein